MPPPNANSTARRKLLLDQLWEMNLTDAPRSFDHLRGRLLLLFCGLSLLVNILYAAATITLGNRAELAVTLVTLAILLTVLVKTLRRGWRRWTAHLYLFSAVLSLLLYIAVSGEAHPSITIWIPFIPMLALLLLERKDGILLTLLYAAIISLAALLVEHTPGHETLSQTLLRITPVLFAILLTSLATLGVILVYIHMRDLIAHRQRQEREAKETLLRILSHDIGNNLTVLRLTSSSTPSNPQAYQRFANTIRDATDGIVEMVDSVRAMRALEDGKLALRIVPADLEAAITKAIRTLTPRFRQKDIQLHIDLPPGPHHILADPVTLEQTIIANLLSNAIKFTPPGGRVGLSIDLDPQILRLHIWDDGIGIPESLRPDLFEPGKHTSRRGTEGEPGTGYGLPLVKKMVEFIHGTITVHSPRPGSDHGTQFTLTFQRA